MMRKYSVLLQQTIEIGGVFEAETGEQAKDIARSELRTAGQVVDESVERCVYLDDEGPDAA